MFDKPTLYFGVNTMRYLQFHFVCTKLFVMFDDSFIKLSSDCVFDFNWQFTILFYTIGVLFQCRSVNLYWTTRLSRGFSFISKKTGRNLNSFLSRLFLSVHFFGCTSIKYVTYFYKFFLKFYIKCCPKPVPKSKIKLFLDLIFNDFYAILRWKCAK